MSTNREPLILTAELPPDLHRRFNDLRQAHFPPDRNHLEAHVTLFHALPAMVEEELKDLLGRLAGQTPRVSGRVEGIMPLGTGTAIRLTSRDMLGVREAIAEHFHGMLTAQDSHPPRLHVTIQNKVTPREAKALQSSLTSVVLPTAFMFRALALHRYRGGPWEFVRRWPFRGK